MTTKTKQPSDGASGAASEICLRLASVVQVAIPSDVRDGCALIIDEHLDPAVKELVEAANKMCKTTEMTVWLAPERDALQSALEPFKTGGE